LKRYCFVLLSTAAIICRNGLWLGMGLPSDVSAYVEPVAGETSMAVLWAIDVAAAIIGLAALGFVVTILLGVVTPG
jgi:hypothetical protein